MAVYQPKPQIPISVAYRKKTGSKVWIKTFTDQKTPDKILSTRSNKLPKDCIVLEVGVGSAFENIYRKKYG
jgi:hypothetical protein